LLLTSLLDVKKDESLLLTSLLDVKQDVVCSLLLTSLLDVKHDELRTPEEMFTGKKPEVSHLKIFGCPVFIHIPKEKRNKLEPSGKKGIFVGYCEVSKAFKIYIPGHRHIEISGDVTFDEEATLKKSRRC
jgi:hypothetical protein